MQTQIHKQSLLNDLGLCRIQPSINHNPVLHVGICTINTNGRPVYARSRLDRLDRDCIKKSITKKILEGKHAIKVICHELREENLITADPNNLDLPQLKKSIIAKYIQEIRESLGIKIPRLSDKILAAHERANSMKKKQSEIINLIIKETGSQRNYVLEVLRKHGRIPAAERIK